MMLKQVLGECFFAHYYAATFNVIFIITRRLLCDMRMRVWVWACHCLYGGIPVFSFGRNVHM
jgi:hypothetical protein